jgi:alpha-tubulin suppressor-like RCC1 family protein
MNTICSRWALPVAFLVAFAACSRSGSSSTIEVVTVMASSSVLDPATTTTLNAGVAGTGAFSDGVNWSIVGGTGTLTAATNSSVIFTAPNLNLPSTTIIRATSTQDPSKTATVSLAINADTLRVRISASRVALRGAEETVLSASVLGMGVLDTSVTWNLENPTVGSLTSTTGNNVTYRAPVDSFGRIVRVTATSVQDSSVRQTMLISINPRKDSLTAGDNHSLALKSDGSLLAWGNNGDAQLGDGTTVNRWIPVAVTGTRDIVAVSAGAFHSLALKSDGTLLAWGSNQYGQLGDGTTINRSLPIAVPQISNIVAIAAGSTHSLALKSDGSLLSWGSNGIGQLGDGTAINRLTPVLVLDANDIVAVAASGGYSLALKSDGTVLSWGSNSSGQLGDGTTKYRSTPVRIPNLSSIVAVAAGSAHALALRSNGALMSWGYNYYGQLGNGINSADFRQLTPSVVSNTNQIVAIAAGNFHSLALKTDGTLLAWGSNKVGQLGDATYINRSVPVAVVAARNVVAIAARGGHGLFLKSDGTLISTGLNDFGQLGDGTFMLRSTPVSVLLGSFKIRLP